MIADDTRTRIDIRNEDNVDLHYMESVTATTHVQKTREK